MTKGVKGGGLLPPLHWDTGPTISDGVQFQIISIIIFMFELTGSLGIKMESISAIS